LFVIGAPWDWDSGQLLYFGNADLICASELLNLLIRKLEETVHPGDNAIVLNANAANLTENQRICQVGLKINDHKRCHRLNGELGLLKRVLKHSVDFLLPKTKSLL
jgi:ribosomal protein L13